jgi:hypothetical protein
VQPFKISAVPFSEQPIFETSDTFFAAVLLARNDLQLVSWDMNERGQAVWAFADPANKGRSLELAYQTSMERRIFVCRGYLMTKARQMGASVGRGNRGQSK